MDKHWCRWEFDEKEGMCHTGCGRVVDAEQSRRHECKYCGNFIYREGFAICVYCGEILSVYVWHKCQGRKA